MPNLSKVVSLLCCMLVLACASLTIQAQDAPQRALLRKVVVKPGMNEQFEEFMVKFKAAVEKTGAPYRWGVSQSFVGGGNHYHVVTPFTSWSTFAEQRNVLEEAYSKREVDRLMKLWQDSVVKVKVSAYTVNPDISRPPPQSDQPNVAVLLYYLTPKQGMGQQMIEYARKVKEATDATAPDLYWNSVNPGIGADSFMVVIWIKDLKELDTPGKPIPQRLTEHFGAEEAAKIMEQGRNSIARVKSKLHRLRPDLALPVQQQ